MKSIKPDLLGVFGADLSLELLNSLVIKGIYNKDEAYSLLIKVAEKHEALSKETSTNANKELAEFARDMAEVFCSQKN